LFSSTTLVKSSSFIVEVGAISCDETDTRTVEVGLFLKGLPAFFFGTCTFTDFCLGVCVLLLP
jgi:hypothetical protein